MPVTTSVAVALSDCRPALVPPAGAVSVVDSVTPVGMAASIAAVIFALLWLVVTE